MLKFLGRRKRSRNALLIIFVGVLTISLVGLFSVIVSGGGAGILGGSGSDTTIAKVGSYKVTMRELRDTLNAYGQQMAQGQGAIRQEDPADLYAQFGQEVLDGLVRQKLVMYEADRLNLKATDQEVQERLAQIFKPWPGPEQYRMRLQQAGTTPIKFEDNLRASITEEHLRSYIAAAAQLSPQEVEEEYRRNNTSYSIRWVEVSSDKYRDKVQTSEADLRSYFDQHKDEFRINTEQRRARYIFIDQSKAGEAVQVSDDELRPDFDPERFVQQVRVSQIVLDVPKQAKPAVNANANPDTAKPSAEEAVKTKAEEIAHRAQGADGKPAEDFAALAREVSQDTRTRAQGGDIGWVNKKDQRETDDPLNRVFSMQAGAVSEPIRKGDKYYILKVTERKAPTFEEAREELLKQVRARKGYSKTVEIAGEAEQRFKESKDAEAVAAELNRKYGAQIASAKETPFFSQGDNLPDLGQSPDFQTALFKLENPGDISEHTNANRGYAVIQYLEKRDPHEAVFEDVKAKVEQRVRLEKARELTAEAARQIAQAANPDALKRAADSIGARTDERAGLSRTDSIGPMVSEANRSHVYKLNPGEITREPIKAEASDVYIVAAMMGRKDADMGEAFEKERKAIEDRLLDEKRATIYQTFLTTTQKRLTEEGKIAIYRDAIEDNLNEGLPDAADQPRRPAAPAPARPTPRRTPQGASPPLR